MCHWVKTGMIGRTEDGLIREYMCLTCMAFCTKFSNTKPKDCVDQEKRNNHKSTYSGSPPWKKP